MTQTYSIFSIEIHYRAECWPAAFRTESFLDTVDGFLLSGLDHVELNILDAFEDVEFTREVLSDEQCKEGDINPDRPPYIYLAGTTFHESMAHDQTWEFEHFKRHHLQAYLGVCREFIRDLGINHKTT
jgi:hypothetical protein